MNGVSPTLYEKLWEKLSRKGFNTPFGSSQLPHFVDTTTWEMDFPRTHYWHGFQDQIENLSHVEDSVIRQETKFPQLVWGTVKNKEDIHGVYLLFTSITSISDVDVVLTHAETGTNHWQDFQRQIQNPSHVEANAIFPEPKSPQFVDEATQIEDVPSLYLSYPHGTSLSDVDTVFASAETGTAITGLIQLQKFQVEKQKLEISEQFDILAQREDNWDGRGSQKPVNLTLIHAKEVVYAFLNSVISAGYLCNTPSISSDGDGNITAVWYNDERQLHFQIGEHEAEYFRVWGTNIDTEMDVDYLKPENYLTLWKWFIDELSFPLDISDTPSVLSGGVCNTTVVWYNHERQLHLQFGE